MPVASALPVLGIYAAAVVAYSILHRLAAAAFGRTAVGGLLRMAWVPTVTVAVAFALLMVLFAAVAAPLRHDPSGSGLYREGDAWREYLGLARSALAGLYLVAIALALLLGAIRAPRDDRLSLAFATFAGALGFMALTSPLSEGLSECYANVTLFLRPSC